MIVFGFALGHIDSFLIFFLNGKVSRKRSLYSSKLRILSSLSPVPSRVLNTQMFFEFKSTWNRKEGKYVGRDLVTVCSRSEESYERSN